MPVKRCKNCNKGFRAQSTGRAATLCLRCSNECDEAFAKIIQYLRENNMPFRLVDKDAIAEAVGVPSVFLWVLAKEGCFGDFSKKHCSHCHKELQPTDRDLCAKCSVIISQQLQIALICQQSPLYATVAPSDTSEQTADEESSRKKKYGLGRKHG